MRREESEKRERARKKNWETSGGTPDEKECMGNIG
jgi:hypothetical protein